MPKGISTLVLVAITLCGCGEWPRYKHVSEQTDLQPGDVDRTTLLTIEWAEGQETPDAENDIPTGEDVRSESLSQGAGVLVEGTLDGTGWLNSLVAEDILSASCAGTIGKRTAQTEGDYTADVDFIVIVDPEDDATLCGRALVDQETLGWDLALLEVDACGIPVATVTDDGGLELGIDLGGARGGWGIPVASNKSYAVLFAGYDPNDPANQVGYTVGISLVGSAPNGSAGVCPLLPEEL